MQPNAHSVTRELTHYEYLRDQLRVQFPDADDQTILDTLEGETKLDDMLCEVMRSSEDDAMLVAGIKERLAELNERKARLERRVEAKREIVCRTMDRANLQKIERPDFTLSLRKSPPSVLITDEALIPDDYMIHPEPPAPKPDKAGIAVALKGGKEIPGCALSNGGVGLQIRKK